MATNGRNHRRSQPGTPPPAAVRFIGSVRTGPKAGWNNAGARVIQRSENRWREDGARQPDSISARADTIQPPRKGEPGLLPS